MEISFRLSEEQRREVQGLLSPLDNLCIQKGFKIEVDLDGKKEIQVVASHLSTSEKCIWSAVYPLNFKIISEGIKRHEGVSHSMDPSRCAVS